MKEVETKIHRVFCEDVVMDIHKYSNMRKSFLEIVNKDYPRHNFGFSDDILGMQCIDLDAVETAQDHVNDRTMDCAIGISKFDDIRRTHSSSRLLLVELKLNHKRHNLSLADYTGKIVHSRNLLSEILLHPSNIFLFTEGVKGIAKNEVFRWSKASNGATLKNVVIMTPTEFNDYIGFEYQFPYKPINKEADIIKEINGYLNNIDKIVSIVEGWKKKATEYRYMNNKMEYNHIIQVLHTSVDSLLVSLPKDEADYLTLVLED